MNPIKLDSFQTNDQNAIGKQLTHLEMKQRTAIGGYDRIGSLYGFNIYMRTESITKNDETGYELANNRFYIKGEGEIYHKFNNGKLATEPKLAATNFLRALEGMPKLVENHKRDIAQMQMDIPSLEKIASTPWRKEEELAALKAEAKEVDLKIQHTLEPIKEDMGEGVEDIPVVIIDNDPADRFDEIATDQQKERLNELVNNTPMLGSISDQDINEIQERILSENDNRQNNDPEPLCQHPTPHTIEGAREALGDRFVIGRVPASDKDIEPKKGIKM